MRRCKPGATENKSKLHQSTYIDTKVDTIDVSFLYLIIIVSCTAHYCQVW